MSNVFALLKILKDVKNTEWQVLAGPILILIILSMMVLPFPPFLLDLFFTFNIALSIIVLLVAMFTRKTLDFTVFPTILLFSTLLRLALNVASTRVILLHGHIGTHAAGNVIKAFGHFLVGGNYAIGIVVFIILVIINFMVITKGASRIAEVGARFVLDGMPGKQMAIDADLNTGLIGEKQAKQRRIEISREADFYGSMDGASKFVRGDAIAGIFIMIINVFGGLVIGIIQHNMFFKTAIEVYTLLTIGDGLAAQIPALVISTAAGVMVTRVSTEENVGEQIIRQLFYNPQIILLSAIVLGFLGLVPGMPNFIFLLFTLLLFVLSLWLFSNSHNLVFFPFQKNIKNTKNTIDDKNFDASWNDVKLEDQIELEVGKKLIPLVNINTNNSLIRLIRSIRKKYARDMGFLPPLIHIRSNVNLSPLFYKILIKGIEVDIGKVYVNLLMAINTGHTTGLLTGEKTIEPVFHFSAIWIHPNLQKEAIEKKYTVVNAVTIIATHLNHILHKHVKELFSRQEAQGLLDYISKNMPKLTEDFIPNTISLTVFHRVLQNLLLERISIKDMRTIVETLIECSVNKENDINTLTSIVRIALGKSIVQSLFKNRIIQIIGLEPNLENILLQNIKNGNGSLEPGLANQLIHNTSQAIKNQQSIGAPPVLVVHHSLRIFLSHFLRDSHPQLSILSTMEIAGVKEIHMTNIIGKNN
ncbi:MAG TPA: flagellar biosynthesis protein FlhA [Buchnera sp. (in: enterobacteria)]|nr:flagellar biosynthesis protein FlhA [Buchnera sp. (in: enterobacteria)]